ncbi:MAG: ribonuclease J [Spirochaetes bacterium]|nr:ribonuclease J [Spirochaetota bacterium]
MKKKKDNKIRIIPLGGLGAIGKNMTLFEYNNDIIIVDCGIMFPNDEMPGVDFIIPDFTYVRENKSKIKGIIITHGHEDHIGAIPYLLKEIDAPIYATKLTIGLIQSRLVEKPPKKTPRFIEIAPRVITAIGGFLIEYINVNHSIIGGVGLAIQTAVGTIIHTGDFKIDFSPVDGQVTDMYRFADYGEKGVLLLMSDSTNSTREGFTRSESVLEDKLIEIFSSSKGRIIVATFASNIHRIQQVLDVAQRYNRKVVISGLTMQKNVEIATDLGYLTYKSGLIIEIQEAGKMPDKKLVIICTGTQGEPLSALSRMSTGNHKHFSTRKGDTVVITASVIPGNERMVTNVVNSLMKLGAEVYYDQDDDIHVSGHGSSKELKLMISITRPRYFMPIHGEYRHLYAHSKIAQSLGIDPSRIILADNGDILDLTQNSFSKSGSINLSQIYVDGIDMGDIESSVIKERNVMSSDGLLIIVIVISEGMLIRTPDIFTKGFIDSRNAKMLELLKNESENKVKNMLREGKKLDEIKAVLVKSMKNFVFKVTKRNPLIDVDILEV